MEAGWTTIMTYAHVTPLRHHFFSSLLNAPGTAFARVAYSMSREAVEREAWWNPTREVSDLALEMIAAGIVYDTENISNACSVSSYVNL